MNSETTPRLGGARRDTRLAQAGSRADTLHGAVTMPIWQTATFHRPMLGGSKGYDYTRVGNPTRTALEETLAELEGGGRAFAFSSGLSALDTALHLVPPGSRILVTEDLYGGTWRLLDQVHRDRGLVPVPVETSNTAAVAHELAQGASALLVESPSNPLLRIADIKALCALAREHQCLSIVDNTFLTAAVQRPLDLGADLVAYSATKSLGGHNDLVAGALVTRRADLAERIYKVQSTVGSALAPFDAWLLLRGLKTLHLRVERAQNTARQLAQWLSEHPQVVKVHFPLHPQNPGAAIQLEQANGPGSMISFEVREAWMVPTFLSSLRVWLFAESLGGCESLATYPWAQTHADIPEATRRRLGISETLIRLSVGLEDPADLMEDLDQALTRPRVGYADVWNWTI